MIETIIGAAVIGFLAALAGTIVGVAVQKNENAHTDRRLKDLESTVKDVVAGRYCDLCGDLQKERRIMDGEKHAETLARITNLEGELREVKRTVQDGFLQLIKEFQKEN